MTHSYAIMEVSAAAFEEIEHKLREAGYVHVIDVEEGLLDMQGIALAKANSNVQSEATQPHRS